MQDEVAFSGFGLISVMMHFPDLVILGMLEKSLGKTNLKKHVLRIL